MPIKKTITKTVKTSPKLTKEVSMKVSGGKIKTTIQKTSTLQTKVTSTVVQNKMETNVIQMKVKPQYIQHSIKMWFWYSGLSAYQIWLNEGNTGTEQDFLDSLIGEWVPSWGTTNQALLKSSATDYATQWGNVVLSFNGRSWPVSPAANDYTMSDITGLIAALEGKIDVSQKWAVNGVATLDANGKIPTAQLASLAISEYLWNFSNTTTALANAWVQASQRGDWFTVSDDGTGKAASYIVTTDSPTTTGHITKLSTPADAVLSVNGQTGTVSLTSSHISEGSNLYFTDIRAVSALTGENISMFTNDAGYITGAGSANHVWFWDDTDNIIYDSYFVWKNDVSRKQFWVQTTDPQASGHFAAVVGTTVAAPATGTFSFSAESLNSAPTASITAHAEPSASGSWSASQNNDEAWAYQANNTSYTWRIYWYKIIQGTTYRSLQYLEFSNTDDNTSSYFNWWLSWDAISWVDGYIIERNGTPVDSTASTSWTDSGQNTGPGYSSWGSTYTAVSGGTLNSPSSMEGPSQDYGYSSYYEDGRYIRYEIDSYITDGANYRSGSPVSGQFQDANMSSYYGVRIDAVSGGSQSGFLIRRQFSYDGGSTWYNAGGSQDVWDYEYLSNLYFDGSDFIDQYFSHNSSAESDWWNVYSGGSSTEEFRFRVYTYQTSPSGGGVYSPDYYEYYYTVTDTRYYIFEHTFSGLSGNAKIVWDINTGGSYGVLVNSNYADIWYNTWGNGPGVTPNHYGFSGTSQNITVRIWALKNVAGTMIESTTYLEKTLSAIGGYQSTSLSWDAVSWASSYKIQRSLNGATYYQTTQSGTTLLDDALRSWGSASSYPTAIPGIAGRFDRASTALTDSPQLSVVNTGASGTRYSLLWFGSATDSQTAESFQAFIGVATSTGYMTVFSSRLDFSASRGSWTTAMIGAQGFDTNMLASSSIHHRIRGQSNQYGAYYFSAYDTYYLGNYNWNDNQTAVQIQPYTSGDAGLVLVGHASHSTSSTMMRVQNSAGSYLAIITSGGHFQPTVGNVSTPWQSFYGDTNTGFYWPSGDNIGITLWGAQMGQFYRSGTLYSLAIGIYSSVVGQIHVKGTASGSIQMVLDQASGQTTDMLRFRNSSATVISSVASNGYQWGINTGGAYWAMFTIYNQWSVKGMLMKQSGSQTVDNIEIQNSAGTRIGAIAAGALFLSGDGSAATPSESYVLDPDTGTYRIGANNVWLSLWGTKYWDYAVAVTTVSHPLNITSSLQCDSIVNDTGLASGTYTPTLTPGTNVTGATAFECQYIRVWNTVHVTGKATITITSAWVWELWVSLPVASNLWADEDCSGIGTGITNTPAASDVFYIKSDATNNRASFNGDDNDASSHDHYFTFTYQVI